MELFLSASEKEQHFLATVYLLRWLLPSPWNGLQFFQFHMENAGWFAASAACEWSHQGHQRCWNRSNGQLFSTQSMESMEGIRSIMSDFVFGAFSIGFSFATIIKLCVGAAFIHIAVTSIKCHEVRRDYYKNTLNPCRCHRAQCAVLHSFFGAIAAWIRPSWRPSSVFGKCTKPRTSEPSGRFIPSNTGICAPY